MKTFIVTIDGVFGVECARRLALRRCAWQAPNLHMEFKRFTRDVVNHEEFVEKIDVFVREKGLRIIAEKPVVKIRDDRYAVDVQYTIGWSDDN